MVKYSNKEVEEVCVLEKLHRFIIPIVLTTYVRVL